MLRIRLKELLFLRDLSEKELSLLTKIDVKIIKKYCNNEIKILRSETLNKFCSVLNCNLDDIIERYVD